MIYRIGVYADGYASRCNTEDGPVECWVNTWGICATDEAGHRWALEGSHRNESRIDVMTLDGAERDRSEIEVQELLAKLGDCMPATAPDRWYPLPPVYGSEAWDSEAEYELACFEADCLDEPRPQWF